MKGFWEKRDWKARDSNERDGNWKEAKRRERTWTARKGSEGKQRGQK